MATDSSDIFYLIDHEGIRRVPHKIAARNGQFGYALHPVGKGNDASAADYTVDARRMVQAVVFEGKGVRTRAIGGPHDGQVNTLGLSGRKIRGYWLAPEYHDWVKGAARSPELATQHTVRPPKAEPIAPEPEDNFGRTHSRREQPSLSAGTASDFCAMAAVRFADHCCQGQAGGLAPGPFALDDLTMVSEGARRLRFAPLGNQPEHPKVALVGITPGGQIERFAKYLRTMDVRAAAHKAAFDGAQKEIKQLLQAHGLARRLGLSLEGDLNDNPDLLTTSIVKCCLMVDDGYRFCAPDIAASPAAALCATQRLVRELTSYPTLKWVLVFGVSAWEALHELRNDGAPVIEVLRRSGLRLLQLPHFAQNFQQRAIYASSPADEPALLAVKPHYVAYAPLARALRSSILEEVARPAT